LAICNIVAVHASVFGERRLLWTFVCVHVRPEGMQKIGKDWGSREVSGVGMGVWGVKKAVGSCVGSIQRIAVGGRWERRIVKAARYFVMVYLMGRMASMLCNGSMGVVWNVPLIQRTASFWAICKIWTTDFGTL